MAITVSLVGAARNRLRYLVVYSGSGPQTIPDITTTGAASPDLKTDSLAGPIKVCALAFTNGIGKLAAGAKTAPQAKAIWLADSADSVLGTKTPRTIIETTPRSGAVQLNVTADVDGSGHPVLQIAQVLTTVAAWSAYVEIETQGGIGA